MPISSDEFIIAFQRLDATLDLNVYWKKRDLFRSSPITTCVLFQIRHGEECTPRMNLASSFLYSNNKRPV
ncbi:MAG: hypothetical protein ACR2HL_07810 [Methylocystis sp.]